MPPSAGGAKPPEPHTGRHTGPPALQHVLVAQTNPGGHTPVTHGTIPEQKVVCAQTLPPPKPVQQRHPKSPPGHAPPPPPPQENGVAQSPGHRPQLLITIRRSEVLMTQSPLMSGWHGILHPPGQGPQALMIASRSAVFTTLLPPVGAMSAGQVDRTRT